MTLAHESAPTHELDLAHRQVQAIERFTRAQRTALEASAAGARGRERRRDDTRTMEVIRREHRALLARAHEQLRLSGNLLRDRARPRVVLAHRDARFSQQVADQLEERDWVVVALLSNGADAVGVTVAEQPELLLVEDSLAMVAGEQVVRDVRQFCPQTVVAAQVASGDRVAALLEAGAASVWTRQVPPRQVAHGLMELVGP